MYREKAEALFVALQDFFDEKGLDNSDLSHSELVVQTRFGVFQLNYHGVTDQIWLSSPISGAHHFTYSQELWISTRSGETLHHILEKEILLLNQ
jgi:frataxin